MPAVTVNETQQWSNGNKIQIVADIDIAADGDTWDTGLNKIDYFAGTPATSALSQIGGTVSDGVITFKTAGAEAGALVTVIGDGA